MRKPTFSTARPAALCLAALAALALALPAHAQWKWRDARGQITVSDTPPPRDIPSKDILQQPELVVRKPVAPPPAASAASAVVAKPSVDPALEDFSWCFDIGMTRVAEFAGVRLSFLVSDIASLAERFPRAREYLELRRLNALATFEDPLSGDTAAAELAAINNALGRDTETVEILLALPVDDPRRKRLGHRGAKELLRDRQRYTDAATLISPGRMLIHFEAQARLVPLLDKMPASAIEIRRQHFIDSVAKDVEVLAGAGRIAESRQAIEMLYTYDHSPGTVELLGQHLERAGAADLLAEIPLPQP